MTILEAFSDGTSLILYVFGFVISLRAINTLADSEVTLWAMKRHAEKEKREKDESSKDSCHYTESNNNRPISVKV